MQEIFKGLSTQLSGEIFYDESPGHQVQLMAYSTDASVYQERPMAVALPANENDIKILVQFANQHQITLLPRAAGTSLAGQVVGSGIVVDISKHLTKIIEVNKAEKWVRVQPGVVRDDLNQYLKSFGLMFGPETSTSNRAMIGGMAGNNSCGLHSIVWGSTRDHLLEASVILSDGSEAVFKTEKINEGYNGLKGSIYEQLGNMLGDDYNQRLITDNFPKATVVRRNSGYALDSLTAMQPFAQGGEAFNLCKLLAGSEGTLAFFTELKLNLLPLPPTEIAVVCIHCSSILESLQANIIALAHAPMASELVDKFIMDFTIGHPEYHKNRFFIEGNPEAILMVEFMEETVAALEEKTAALIAQLRQQSLGYAYPVLLNADTRFAWEIRKAGLGLLRNLRGDTQPVNLIEDCAVSPYELPGYIEDLQKILVKHNVKASYYAHAGAGELHVEPMVNLKSAEGLKTFRALLADTAGLVKKYKGSLSGEHGDGRLRGEFIEAVVGQETYKLFKEVKRIFDPNNIFNAGKIVGTPPMDEALRFTVKPKEKLVTTTFDFSGNDGILRLAEKCSGSGDCRKTEITGGLMCPSYMATRREKDTTRARANVLRQFLSNDGDADPFDHKEIKEVMDLCLSCKGCKIECPSSVDVTKMKAEFLQQYQDKNGIPFRSKMIANFSGQMALASKFSSAYNLVFGTKALRKMANKAVGFHPERSIPLLPKQTLRAWIKSRKEGKTETGKPVLFFCDEFTNYLDVEIGKKAIMLLETLGYTVIFPEHVESGRSYLSKGLVKKAAGIANENIDLLADKVSAQMPLIGLEPSAILTLRDEYLDLCYESNKARAKHLARHTFTIEEFLAKEITNGNITAASFHADKKNVAVHGHCYQKVLSSQEYFKTILSLPKNYEVEIIPSGCCGMAGSFGYEEEHYEVSQKIGELVLFPYIRKLEKTTIVAASGTSCRHQIKDGTERIGLHPVEVLWAALI